MDSWERAPIDLSSKEEDAELKHGEQQQEALQRCCNNPQAYASSYTHTCISDICLDYYKHKCFAKMWKYYVQKKISLVINSEKLL